MMKKLYLLVLAAVVCSQTATAQSVVENIRKAYAEAKAEIANISSEDGYPPEYYQLNVVQNLPGTGPHHEDVLMIFKEEPAPEGVVYPPHRIFFVTTKYNFAARQFYEEYLFDDDGNLAFIYAFSPDVFDGKENELRFYFDRGKLVKLTTKQRNMGDTTFTDEATYTTCPDTLSRFYQEYLAQAFKLKRLFKSVDNATRL